MLTEKELESLDRDWTKRMNSYGTLRAMLPPLFPEIITLCGSTRFETEYREAQRVLTLKGKLVISVGLFGHQEGIDMGGPVKAMLDRLHLRKIDISDAIFVVNPGGYVGASTTNEIVYALRNGKRVYALAALPPNFSRPDLIGYPE